MDNKLKKGFDSHVGGLQTSPLGAPLSNLTCIRPIVFENSVSVYVLYMAV